MLCLKCNGQIPDDAVMCCYCGRKYVKKLYKRTRANGMGTAYKRGNTWTAVYTVSWKKDDEAKKLLPIKRTKGGFRTKKDALDYCATLRGEKPKDRLTLRAQYDAWEASKKFDSLSDSKKTAYKIAFGRLKPIEHMSISDIRLEDIQPVIDEINTYYPARDVKQVLSHLLKLAVIDGRAEKNYSEYISLPNKSDPTKDAFTGDEVASLWKLYETDQFVGYILLMIYTGMALGELQNVKRANVDFSKRLIYDVGTKNALRKKTPIFICDMIYPVLEALYERSERSKKLLNMNEVNFYKRYYDALEKGGCRRLTPHCCRHTTATALAEIGVQPAIIMAIMRHSKYQTTMEYTHIDSAIIVSALNEIFATDNAQTTNGPKDDGK